MNISISLYYPYLKQVTLYGVRSNSLNQAYINSTEKGRLKQCSLRKISKRWKSVVTEGEAITQAIAQAAVEAMKVGEQAMVAAVGEGNFLGQNWANKH